MSRNDTPKIFITENGQRLGLNGLKYFLRIFYLVNIKCCIHTAGGHFASSAILVDMNSNKNDFKYLYGMSDSKYGQI